MNVYTAYTVFEGDIIRFRNQEFGIMTSVFQVCDYSPCDFSCVDCFADFSVRAAFARGIESVTGIYEDFHVVIGDRSGIPFAKVINFIYRWKSRIFAEETGDMLCL